jgi:hypothetical protein
MNPWPHIPDDVVAWFRSVFAEANRRVCERLVNLPNVRETSLDDGLIEALIPESAPTLLSSGAIVRMDTHNIGGLLRNGWPRWDPPFIRRWETADIAILVFVYQREKLIAKKIGLLQSKRLYPDNNDVDDDEDEFGLLSGMNAFIRRDDAQAVRTLHRQFLFNEGSPYGAMRAGKHQIQAIDTLNQEFGKTVYYLLYHPHEIPLSVSYPLKERVRLDTPTLGCRVLDADEVHQALVGLKEGESPIFKELMLSASIRNWRLETWAADLLLTCQVGEQFDASREDRVRYFLERRSGPIGAALAVSITLPDS